MPIVITLQNSGPDIQSVCFFPASAGGSTPQFDIAYNAERCPPLVGADTVELIFDDTYPLSEVCLEVIEVGSSPTYTSGGQGQGGAWTEQEREDLPHRYYAMLQLPTGVWPPTECTFEIPYPSPSAAGGAGKGHGDVPKVTVTVKATKQRLPPT